MKCKYCTATMGLEGQHEYCCDNCGATFDAQDNEWTKPVVPELKEMNLRGISKVLRCAEWKDTSSTQRP